MNKSLRYYVSIFMMLPSAGFLVDYIIREYGVKSFLVLFSVIFCVAGLVVILITYLHSELPTYDTSLLDDGEK